MEYRNTLMWEELTQAPEIITACIKNNTKVFDQIVKIIEKDKIKNIYAVARGTSNHALIFFKYAVEIMAGIPVTLGAMSVVTLYEGALNLEGNLVIGCSQSGKAVDVCEILKKANAQKATTLAITNYKDSPMAKEAKFHIDLSAGEERSVAATKTFTSQLCVLLCLAAKLGKKQDIFAEINKLSDTLKGNLDTLDNITLKFAKEFKDIKDGFILGRGLSYPIALESALKLQETSYIAVKGYAMSDFFHGPMAMVNSGTPIIIYAPQYGGKDTSIKKNIFEDAVKGIDKMLSLHARVLIVTDCLDLTEKYKDACQIALLPQSINEYLSIFNFAIFAQMFANKISCLIGNNPDSPRALSKVTITK